MLSRRITQHKWKKVIKDKKFIQEQTFKSWICVSDQLYMKAPGFCRWSFRFLYLYASQTPRIWNHKINIKITSQPVPKIRKKSQNLNTLTKLHVNNFIQYFHISSSMFSEPKDVQCLLTSVKLKNRLIPPTKRRASSA